MKHIKKFLSENFLFFACKISNVFFFFGMKKLYILGYQNKERLSVSFDQTVRIHRLISIFPGSTCPKLHSLTMRIHYEYTPIQIY